MALISYFYLDQDTPEVAAFSEATHRLAQAIERGDVLGVQEALGEGANAQARIPMARVYQKKEAEPVYHSLLFHAQSVNDGGISGTHRVAIMRLLLAHGADPNAPDANGHTVLAEAVANGSEGEVALLLEYGADPHAPLPEGDSVLHGLTHVFRSIQRPAYVARYVRLLTQLQAAGVALDARDGQGQRIWAVLAAKASPIPLEAVLTVRPLAADDRDASLAVMNQWMDLDAQRSAASPYVLATHRLLQPTWVAWARENPEFQAQLLAQTEAMVAALNASLQPEGRLGKALAGPSMAPTREGWVQLGAQWQSMALEVMALSVEEPTGTGRRPRL